MTADEIRKIPVAPSAAAEVIRPEDFTLPRLLREIAAQLAELNQTLKQKELTANVTVCNTNYLESLEDQP